MRLRLPHANPMGSVLWLSLSIFLLGVLSLLLFLVDPASVGLLKEDYLENDVYSLESLRLDRPNMRFEISAGTMAPVYRGGEVSGIVIIAPGRYTFVPPAEGVPGQDTESTVVEDSFTALYMTASYQEFEGMRLASGAKRAENTDVLATARKVLADSARASSVQAFGVARAYFPEETSYAAWVKGENYGILVFTEGRKLSLHFPDLDRLLVYPNPNAGTAPLFSFMNPRTPIFLTLIMYALIVLSLILLIYVLTVDIEATRHWHENRRRPTRREVAFLLSLVLLDAVFLSAAHRWQLENEIAAAGHAVLAVLIFLFLRREERNWAGYLGFTRENLARGLLAAVGLGLLGVMAGTVSFPRGIRFVSLWVFAGQFAWSFLVVGLLQVILHHGFIQTTLQRVLGLRNGLLAASWTVGLVYLTPKLLLNGPPTASSLVEGLILLPLTSLLIGYLFQRTGNAYAAAVYRGLLDFIPKVMKF